MRSRIFITSWMDAKIKKNLKGYAARDTLMIV
jgi:hypothetical protein